MKNLLNVAFMIIVTFIISQCILIAKNEETQQTGGTARSISLGSGGFGLTNYSLNDYDYDLEKRDKMYLYPTHPYMKDPTAMFINPAWMTEYPNLIYSDIGEIIEITNNIEGNISKQSYLNNQFFGISFQAGKNWFIGGLITHLPNPQYDYDELQEKSSFPQGSAVKNPLYIDEDKPLINNIELMGAYRTKSISFGLGLSYCSNSDVDKPADGESTDNGVNQIGLNAGILADFGSDNKLDIGITYIDYSYGTGSENVSKGLIMVNSRFFYQMSKEFTIVPLMNIYLLSNSEKMATSIFSLDAGIGGNYQTNDLLFTCGISLGYNSTTTPDIPIPTYGTIKLNATELIFPRINLGAEWKAMDWMKLRIGYTTSTNSTTTESAQILTNRIGTNTKSTTDYDTYLKNSGIRLGIGLMFGDFYLDAVMNPGLLYEGVHILSAGGNSFGFISAGYSFNK